MYSMNVSLCEYNTLITSSIVFFVDEFNDEEDYVVIQFMEEEDFIHAQVILDAISEL